MRRLDPASRRWWLPSGRCRSRPAEEVHEKLRVRSPAALQSLQDELFELRAQFEGFQLELPDVNQAERSRSWVRVFPVSRGTVRALYGLTLGEFRALHA